MSDRPVDVSDRPVDVLSEALTAEERIARYLDEIETTADGAIDGHRHVNAPWLVSVVREIRKLAARSEAVPAEDGLRELRALSEAATPGPWIVTPDTGSYGAEIATIEDGIGVVRPDDDLPIEPGDPEADAALIVAAVNYVRAALASTERATGEDWNRLLDYLEVNAPADVDDVIAVLEVRAHRAEKRAAATPDNAGRSPIDVERLARAEYEYAVSGYRRETRPSWDEMIADTAAPHDKRRPYNATNADVLSGWRRSAAAHADRYARLSESTGSEEGR